ncbi:PEP-CTERM system histidine kinase PrsK [Thalassotalea sp. HSM 43]|uniref:XrtA/PEP-CTERM system histidine kinase PrsK n=1 Tax=Thalassotalea sp. HSM 43 TaxID=2552945 RepID=UPI001081F954|nr:XrtA/PEP-CTERM system histidine kinase PrsK [Thalassotalea sp. HSM 43]QBY04191.1 PEP-CTERM system histidine kinase PrsK [Thalassotalea sp. HSM 43]
METIGLIGYGLAAIAYLFLLVLLISHRQPSVATKILLVSVAISLVVYLLNAWQVYQSFSLRFGLVFESLRLMAWGALFLLVISGSDKVVSLVKLPASKNFILLYLGLTAVIVVNLFFNPGYQWLFIGLLSMNLLTLVVLEQLYRNSQQLKWALWPLTIGLGGMLVFDFVMYAQAALLNRVDFYFWYSRGYIALLVMPFILLSAKRMRNWSPDLYISRDVVFYSSMVGLSAVYLLILAFSGYVIRFIEGQWSEMLSIMFMAAGLLVLLALLITNRLRDKIRVFIGKHFFANKYDYRQEWLKLIEAIEQQDSQDAYANACAAMGGCFGVSRCGFIDAQQARLQAKYVGDYTLDDNMMQQIETLHQFSQKQNWLVDVREFQSYPYRYPELQVDAKLLAEQRLDLFIPTLSQQRLLGYFILAGPAHKPVLNWEDRDYLFAVSKQLGNYLTLQTAQKQLAQGQQFAVFHRMSAFVLHDLKNVQAQLSLINRNAERHRDNPEFIRDVFATVESASERMGKMVSQLQSKSQDVHKKHGDETVDIAEIINNCLAMNKSSEVAIESDLDGDLYVTANKEGLENVFLHLLQNAKDACNGDGLVQINGHQQQDQIVVDIKDNGCGMSADFIKHSLFEPFTTTKGNAGMGIGVYEAKQFIEEYQGSIDVSSEPGKGSCFTLFLPKSTAS